MSNISPKVEASPSNKSFHRKSNAKDVTSNTENLSRTSDGSQNKGNQFRSCHCPASNMVGLGNEPTEEKGKRQKIKKLTKYDCKRVDVTPFFIYLLTLHLNQKKTSQAESEGVEKNCCQTSNFLLKKIIDRVSTVGHASYGGACGKCNNEGCGEGSSKCCDCGGEEKTKSCQCNQSSIHEKCFEEFDKKYGDFHAKVSKLLSKVKPEANVHKCPCTKGYRETYRDEIDPEILKFCRHMKTQRPYGDDRSEERLYPFPSCKSQVNQEDRLKKIIDAIIKECADEGILKERLVSAIHESEPESKHASRASFDEDKKYVTADSIEAFVKKEIENVLKKHDIDCISNFENCGCKEKATCPILDKKPPIIQNQNYCPEKPPIFGPCVNCGCPKSKPLNNVPSNVYYFLQENAPKVKCPRKREKVCQAGSKSPEKSKETKMTMTRETYKANFVETKPMVCTSPVVYETNIAEFHPATKDKPCDIKDVKSLEKICPPKSRVCESKYCQLSKNIKPPFPSNFRPSNSEILVFGQSGNEPECKVSDQRAFDKRYNEDPKTSRCAPTQMNVRQSHVSAMHHQRNLSQAYENLNPCSSAASRKSKGTSFQSCHSDFIQRPHAIPVHRDDYNMDIVRCSTLLSLDECDEQDSRIVPENEIYYENVDPCVKEDSYHPKGDIIHITCSPSTSSASDGVDPCEELPDTERSVHRNRRDTCYRKVDIIQGDCDPCEEDSPRKDSLYNKDARSEPRNRRDSSYQGVDIQGDCNHPYEEDCPGKDSFYNRDARSEPRNRRDSSYQGVDIQGDCDDPCDEDSPGKDSFYNARSGPRNRRDTRYQKVDIIQDNFTRDPPNIGYNQEEDCRSPEQDPSREFRPKGKSVSCSPQVQNSNENSFRLPRNGHKRVREACVSPVRMTHIYAIPQNEDPCLKSHKTPKPYHARPKLPPKMSPRLSLDKRESLKTVVARNEVFKESNVQIKTRLRPRSPPLRRISPKMSKFSKNSADTLKSSVLDTIPENKEWNQRLRPRSPPPAKTSQVSEQKKNIKELKPMANRVFKKATRRISYSTKTGNRGYINDPKKDTGNDGEPMYYSYNSKLRVSDPDWKPVDQAMRETYETDSDEIRDTDIEDTCGIDPGSSTEFNDDTAIYRMPKFVPIEIQNGKQYQLCLDKTAHPVLVELTNAYLQNEIKEETSEYACQRTLSTIPEEDVETSGASNSAKEELERYVIKLIV